MEKAIFSRIHRFSHTSYADIVGDAENGYEGCPCARDDSRYLSVGRHPLSRLPPCHLSPRILLK